MPTEAVAQVHYLVTAAEKNEVKMFTDMKGIVLSGKLTEYTNEERDVEIATSGNQQPTVLEPYIAINKVTGNNIESSSEDTIIDSQIVQSENKDTKNYTQDNNENERTIVEAVIKHEVEMSEERVIIDDVTSVMEINMSQMTMQQQEDITTSQPPMHSYNLRKCLTKQKE